MQDAYNLKQEDRMTVEQLNCSLINVILKYGYSQDKLDGQKVKVLFNVTKDFDIKHYERKQPLSFPYHSMFDKYKVQEILVVYHHKAQESTATIITEIHSTPITTIKNKTIIRSHHSTRNRLPKKLTLVRHWTSRTTT